MRGLKARCVTGLFVLPLFTLSLGETLRAADRITVPVDDSRRITLAGHVSPRIAAATDQGPVDPSMQLPYVTLVLAPSASQSAALAQLLEQQQTPGSPNYHAWLTPEQYGVRFGVSQADIAKIKTWLGGHGLMVKSVARGQNTIAFGGTAAQISSAFNIEIHHYLVGGQVHYANNAEPTIPVAFQRVVAAIHGLDDFRLRPMPAARPRSAR